MDGLPSWLDDVALFLDVIEDAKTSTAVSATPSDERGAEPTNHKKKRNHELSPAARKERRRLQHANNSRRLRERKKAEMTTLKAEELELTDRLEILRHKPQRPGLDQLSSQWEHAASTERRKWEQAEVQNKTLRRDLYIKNAYARSLQDAFGLPKKVGLYMSHFLHSPVHLPIDAGSRARALEAACTKDKLNFASRILEHETASIRPYTTPSFKWMPLSVDASSFGVTSVAVYALDTSNAYEVFQAASNAIATSGIIWPSYSLTSSSVQQFDVSSTTSNIQYRVTENRFQSSTSNEHVMVECRDMSYCQVGEKELVFLWDYVDDDESHPFKKTATVKRCTVGALLVRPEVCDDGADRVVCRYVCTKIHTIHSSELPPDVERFSRVSEVGARVADSLVFETVKRGVCSTVASSTT